MRNIQGVFELSKLSINYYFYEKLIIFLQGIPRSFIKKIYKNNFFFFNSTIG